MTAPSLYNDSRAKALIFITCLIVGLLHFLVNPHTYAGPGQRFVTSYLMDILVPFSFYLLTFTFRSARLPMALRALIVLTGCFVVEGLQYFHYPVFGQTFDYLDLVAYTMGVALGVTFEQFVLRRLIRQTPQN